MDNGVVKVMLAIPTMGYCAPEAYCNRLGSYLHLGRLEEQGKWLHRIAKLLRDECPGDADRLFKKLIENETIYYTNQDGKRFILY